MTDNLNDLLRTARNLGRADMAYWISGATFFFLVAYGVVERVTR